MILEIVASTMLVVAMMFLYLKNRQTKKEADKVSILLLEAHMANFQYQKEIEELSGKHAETNIAVVVYKVSAADAQEATLEKETSHVILLQTKGSLYDSILFVFLVALPYQSLFVCNPTIYIYIWRLFYNMCVSIAHRSV
jgi:hypothetical protein